MVIQEFINESKNLDGKISKGMFMEICYLFGYFWVQVGKASTSLIWINKILNEPKTELRTDIQSIARIINLIAHYELGNREFIEYNLKSTTRFLANRDRLYQFERVTLKYIRQLANIHPDKDPKETLVCFQKEMTNVLSEDSDQKALGLFNVLIWIQARIENVLMAEIIQNKEKEVKSNSSPLN
ncbi:MAG TPA: hypothetical protein ENJ82_04685 [Bacteroidetes bacterium]|nr:hypothetical protein [Bacteroidota bacterium]